MPLFRKKVNKVALSLNKAKKVSTTKFLSGGRVMFDAAGEKKKFQLTQKLEAEMKKRITGVKGLIRTKLNPKAVNRLKKIRLAQEAKKKKEATNVVKSVMKRNLTKNHPLLRGVFTNDFVLTRSKSGNIRSGKILDATNKQLLVESSGKRTIINLDRLSEVRVIQK